MHSDIGRIWNTKRVFLLPICGRLIFGFWVRAITFNLALYCQVIDGNLALRLDCSFFQRMTSAGVSSCFVAPPQRPHLSTRNPYRVSKESNLDVVGRQAVSQAPSQVTATHDTGCSKWAHSISKRNVVRPRWRAHQGEEIQRASQGTCLATLGSHTSLRWLRLSNKWLRQLSRR